MKRNRFIKLLMAAGVSRNTAAEAASAAAWGGRPLDKTLGYLLTLRGIFAWRGSKPATELLEEAILRAAALTYLAPHHHHRIRPLTQKHRPDGLRPTVCIIDEMASYAREVAAHE